MGTNLPATFPIRCIPPKITTETIKAIIIPINNFAVNSLAAFTLKTSIIVYVSWFA